MHSQFCVIGKSGFLGGALARSLGAVTVFPTEDTRVIFDFGSHVHPDFELSPHYQMQQVISRMTALLPLCVDRQILYVFPSSALVYENDTPFSRFKKTLEQLASCYDVPTLGLRIFPTYGPGDHGTVISQWCRTMADRDRPVVYGDGEQSRDFIYIDDVVEQILYLVRSHEIEGLGLSPDSTSKHRIADIGVGQLTTFNDIVAMINAQLGTRFTPWYMPRPDNYPDGVQCPNPLPARVSIENGIWRMLCRNIQAPAVLADANAYR